MNENNQTSDINYESAYDLAYRHRWSALIARGFSHPHEIALQDDDGLTVLHWACFNEPTLRVIQALIHYDPTKSVGCIQDEQGMTPLHCACSCLAGVEVISALVTLCPASLSIADYNGWNCLHHLYVKIHDVLTREYMTLIGSTIISRTREAVNTILMMAHYLVEFDATKSISTKKDSEGCTPMMILGEYLQHPQIMEDEALRKLALRLVVASLGISNCNMEANLVHEMIGMGECPLQIANLIITEFPGMIRKRDHLGKTPLHVAAERNPNCPHSLDIIRRLVETYPEAAQVRDNVGRLSLERAIESGRTWKNGVREIVDAYPPSVSCVNVDIRFIPVLFANMGEDNVPNTVFDILRATPDLMLHRKNEVNK